jgi:hypothetical protein
MHLVQMLLPVADNEGARFPAAMYARIRAELTERFGGVTAFVQSPALGLWKGGDAEPTSLDHVVLVEVMVEALDRSWWAAYRSRLEAAFCQDEVLIRAVEVDRL